MKWQRAAITAGALALSATCPVAAQSCLGWRQLFPVGDLPAPREAAAMVFDSVRNELVLYGGFGGVIPQSAYQGDTWAWDGATWTRRATTGPLPRFDHAMAFDAARGVTLMHGGYANAPRNDFWQWNGQAWTQITVADGPSIRTAHAMTYDSVRSVVVLFGGSAFSATLGDTWEWDGASWHAGPSGPPPRSGHAMAFDAARGVTVLFGGYFGIPLSDTWEWDGQSWTQRMITGPTGRYGHAMAYDAQRHVIVLNGGSTQSTDRLGDTWEYDGTAWHRSRDPGPLARREHVMAFDAARGQVVLFGGLAGPSTDRRNDTYLFQSDLAPPPAFTRQPQDRLARLGEAVSFESAADGTGVVQYQWRHDGSLIPGAVTPMLSLTGVTESDAGVYDVVATDRCGQTTSRGASLVLRAAIDCSQWQRVGGPEARFGTGMAFDSSRGVAVMFAGDASPYYNDELSDTWEWNGSVWRFAAATGPGPRKRHSMAFDSLHHRTVLFGGVNDGSGGFRDTWTWDGQTWTFVANSGPPAAADSPMVFDSARGVTVLCLGAQTWELATTTWTLRAGPGPSSYGGAMAYDARRARCVLVRLDDPRRLRQTWEWDGSAWLLRDSASDGLYGGVAAAFDSARGRTVLVQSLYRSGVYVSQTTEWDGLAWSQPVDCPPRFGGASAIVFDDTRLETVAYGGISSDEPVGTLWAWDGIDWRLRAGLPLARAWAAMAFDTARRRAVMFGGVETYEPTKLATTWEYDAGAWIARESPGPDARRYTALAYDAARGVSVLFGGLRHGAPLGDTWEWDGSQWTRRAQSGPTPRYGHAMAFDAARGVTVLCGGHSGLAYLGDTWEWDGYSWMQRAADGPAPRFAPALAYDARRGVCVLFGGATAAQDLGDTWEWDGAQWTPRPVLAAPPARSEGAMAFDADRGLTVLYAGLSGATPLADVWEWDGTAWLQHVLTGPHARRGHAMAYDTARGAILMFGGYTTYADNFMDTWELQGLTGPVIDLDPSDATVPELGRLELTVQVRGTPPLSYQWYRGGDAIPGASGANLVIEPVTRADAGEYTVQVTNVCADAWSAPATVTVTPCAANWNGDASLDTGDLFDFLTGFFATPPNADFNRDGATTSADFFEFLAAWIQGC